MRFRPWRLAWGAAAVLGTVVLRFGLVPADASNLLNKDFGQEYLLARAIRDGVDPYQPIRELASRYVEVAGRFDKGHPTPHPPTVGLFALPLGFVDYPTAARIWLGFELACLAAGVVLLIRGTPAVRLRDGLVVALALIAWPPITLELALGQLMLPLLALLAGSQVSLLAQRPVLGGALLGISLVIKPIAWPWLLVLALRREWRAVLSAAVVAGVLAAASFGAIGVGNSVNYLTRVLPQMSTAFFEEPTNMSLWTVAPRLGVPGLGWALPAVIVIVGTAWARHRNLRAGLAVMTITCLLASPITWYFYLVLAVLPLAYLVDRLRRPWSRAPVLASALAVVGVALASVSQTDLLDIASRAGNPTVLLLPTLGLCVMGGLVAWADQHT